MTYKKVLQKVILTEDAKEVDSLFYNHKIKCFEYNGIEFKLVTLKKEDEGTIYKASFNDATIDFRCICEHCGPNYWQVTLLLPNTPLEYSPILEADSYVLKALNKFFKQLTTGVFTDETLRRKREVDLALDELKKFEDLINIRDILE